MNTEKVKLLKYQNHSSMQHTVHEMFSSVNQKGKQRHRLKENIKLVLQEIRCEGEDRIAFAQEKMTCEHCSGSLGHIKCRDFHDWLGNYWLLKGTLFHLVSCRYITNQV
jgi:hypothetical protein